MRSSVNKDLSSYTSVGLLYLKFLYLQTRFSTSIQFFRWVIGLRNQKSHDQTTKTGHEKTLQSRPNEDAFGVEPKSKNRDISGRISAKESLQLKNQRKIGRIAVSKILIDFIVVFAWSCNRRKNIFLRTGDFYLFKVLLMPNSSEQTRSY